MITEDALEQQALTWFRESGWEAAHGPDLAVDGSAPEREDYQSVVLKGRLTQALTRLNPKAPAHAIEEALQVLLKFNAPNPVQRNREFHNLMLSGIHASWREGDDVKHELLRVVDFADWNNNDFLVVNQFAIRGNGTRSRRPDVLVFLNGLPVAIVELKNPADSNADIWKAYQQLQTYKEEIPELFQYNTALVVSDGITARVGSLTANQERFLPWRTLKTEDDRPNYELELQTVVQGFFDRELFLDYLKHFVIFESDGDRLIKKIAGYHQFHAVREAVRVTVIASDAAPDHQARELPRADYGKRVQRGSRRAGVVWHTQGSGKSISMVCYAGKLIQQPEMRNPTIVVVTDRNDLDGQLYETFCCAQELLRQVPEQADSREALREKLSSRQAGGIIFTTIQKFALNEGETDHPRLCERENVVVISDEAHRSQYGLKPRLDTTTGRYVYGFAKHLRDALPNASFIGFTGTPIEQEDRDTVAVFGEYISIYDIQDAVKDQATVEIYYESRLAKLDINQAEIEALNERVEELVIEQEENQRERTKSVWAQLEKLVGAAPRVKEVAADLVKHFESRTAVVEGKAMIVAMSRDVCARLYEAIVALRPEWHDADIEKGCIKVVMTGSASDEAHLQAHLTSKSQKKRLEKRFKDPKDPLKLVIVRDMWLTGFDAPCCHTMYVDKPMKGHNLMQAIARVNRVFKDKPGGLVVDYIGIANDLKAAMKTYTDSNGQGQPTRDAKEYFDELMKRLLAVRDMFRQNGGFDYSSYREQPLPLLVPAMQHLLSIEEGKKRFLDLMTAITKAYAMCSTLEEAVALRMEIAFLSAVKAALMKHTSVESRRTEADRHSSLRQIIDNALISDGVTDIFALAGLSKPNIGLLSESFMDELRHLKHKNLAVELLEKLLKDEIKSSTRTNVALKKKFGDRLKEALTKYHNRSVETAKVIEEMIQMAKDFREALSRNAELGLNSDEVAFYDALADRPEVLRTMGNDTLRQLAVELTEQLRKSTTVDWQVRESVRAKMRVLIKRLLRKHKYPPEGQETAVDLVLQQAEVLSEEWSSAL